MISGQLDHRSIKAQLDTGASQVVLKAEAARRVQWALMFSQLCMARLFIGFLGYKLENFKLKTKDAEDWGFRAQTRKRPKEDWKGKGAEDIRVEDVCGQAPPNALNGHEQQIEECLLLAHKIVHLAYHEPHALQGDNAQAMKVDAAIPVVVKLLQQWVYRPIGETIPLPDDYRKIMDDALPGWDA